MKSQAIIYAALLFTTASVSVHAGDLRVWKDQGGKTMEAEYVKTVGDKVVLKTKEGGELKISLETLSERDQRYVTLQQPPRLSISISPKTSRSNSSLRPAGPGSAFQVTEETVTVSAKVKKSSSAPYEAPLRFELYLLGSHAKKGGYMLLSKTTSRFQFTTENRNQFETETEPINLTQVDYREGKGVSYSGYLAIIRDRTGEILELKCSKLDFEQNKDAILGAEKGTIFDDDFKPVKVKKTPDTRKGVDPKRDLKPGRRL